MPVGELDNVIWRVPPFEASPSYKVGFIEEFIREGEGYIEGQPCYKDLARNLRILDAIFRDKTKSTLVTNKLKYNIRKFCETLSEIREIAAYGSDFPGWKPMAEMLTKVSRAIYLESDFPYQILKVLQYATVMGIGYLWPKVRADDYGFGERKLTFTPLGLLDVIPVQVPSTNDVQDAYGVTIYDYMPIAEAHGRFPLFQGQFQAVGRRNYHTQLQAKRLDHAETFRYGDQGRSFGSLYTEVRWSYIRDLRINTTGFVLPMGDPGTTWYYEVPYVGQDIFGGYRNGEPYMRPAQVEDCRVYPNLRLIITSNGIERPLYDGPGFDWDPKIPVVQYVVDDWAWDPLGKSLVSDVAAIETTKRKIERQVDQAISAGLNPPLAYDINSIGGDKAQRFDIFDQDVRYGVDGKPKEVFDSILPPTVAAGSIHFEYLKYLADAEVEQLGLLDAGNLINIKMNIANDTADKMLESIGPIARGIAMRIERGNKCVGNRMKYLIPQYFDTRRLMEYVGPEGIAREQFDYDPDSMVPSHMPDEIDPASGLPPQQSRYDRLMRGKWFCKQLRLTSVPNNMLRITQMQEQLKYLQLKRGQAPISWLTVFRRLDIPNPEHEIEQSFQEEVKLEKMKVLAQIELAQDLKKMGVDPQAMMGGGQQQGGQQPQNSGAAKRGGGAGKPGRPATNSAPARLKQKGAQGGEPRTVVTTSK